MNPAKRTKLDPRRPLFVEYIGLQGAGKTTLSRRVIELLNAEGYRVVVQGGMGLKTFPKSSANRPSLEGWSSTSIWHRLRVYGRLHLKLGRLAGVLYRYVLFGRRPTAVAFRAVRSLVLLQHKLLNAMEVVRSGEADFILFGQGAVNYLRAIVASKNLGSVIPLDRVLRPLFEQMSAVQWVIVQCDVDVPTAVQRINSRPRDLGRFDRMDPRSAEAALSLENGFTDMIVAAFQNEGLVASLFRVDMTGELEANAQSVANHIKTHLASMPTVLTADPIAGSLERRRNRGGPPR